MDDLGDDVVAAAHQVQHLEVVQRVRGESAEEARHPVMAAARREVIEMRALPEVVFPVGVPRHVRSEQGEQCRDVPTAERLIGSADDSDTCRSAIRSRGTAWRARCSRHTSWQRRGVLRTTYRPALSRMPTRSRRAIAVRVRRRRSYPFA